MGKQWGGKEGEKGQGVSWEQGSGHQASGKNFTDFIVDNLDY